MITQNYETLVTPIVGYLGEVNMDLIDYNKDEVSFIYLDCLFFTITMTSVILVEYYDLSSVEMCYHQNSYTLSVTAMRT